MTGNGNGNGNGASVATKRQRLSALTAAFVVFAALALVATLSGVAYLSLQNNGQNHQIEKVLREAKQQQDDIARALATVKQQSETNGNAVDVLLDCTRRGGKCYERQQKQIQQFFDTLADARTRTIVAAFVCNDRPGGQQIKPLMACVGQLLDKKP